MASQNPAIINDLEELILLAVGNLHPDAYGYAVKKELRTSAGRSVSLATIYTALYRLERQGLLESRLGGREERRGGRSKRLFTLTAAGVQAVRRTRMVRDDLWKGMKPVLDIHG